MKRGLTVGFFALLIGAALGAGIVARLGAAQENRDITGYAFWSKADGNLKFAYLIGYSDAEQIYRAALDGGAKPLCVEPGKAWIEDFEQKFPIPNRLTIKQSSEGIDEFYKDWKNQGVDLLSAQRIVRLQVAGRPQAEIEEAIKRARGTSSR